MEITSFLFLFTQEESRLVTRERWHIYSMFPLVPVFFSSPWREFHCAGRVGKVEKAADEETTIYVWTKKKMNKTRTKLFDSHFSFFFSVGAALCWTRNLVTHPSPSVFPVCTHDSATKEREAERVPSFTQVRRSVSFCPPNFLFFIFFWGPWFQSWWWRMSTIHRWNGDDCDDEPTVKTLSRNLCYTSFVKTRAFRWRFTPEVCSLSADSAAGCTQSRRPSRKNKKTNSVREIPKIAISSFFFLGKTNKTRTVGVSWGRFHLNNTQQSRRSYRDKRAGHSGR